MIISPATLQDIPAIRAIAQVTWPHAYVPAIMDERQLAYMLELLYSPTALGKAMTVQGQIFLLASEQGKPGAFAGFTPHHREGVTYLNKLYALPAWQGRGAGRLLLERVIEMAMASGDRTLELNVNKRNKAISFYERMGFRIDREEVIEIGSGYVMDDYVMARSL